MENYQQKGGWTGKMHPRKKRSPYGKGKRKPSDAAWRTVTRNSRERLHKLAINALHMPVPLAGTLQHGGNVLQCDRNKAGHSERKSAQADTTQAAMVDGEPVRDK